MPAGAAAAQARISAIEQRFAVPNRTEPSAGSMDFDRVLATARTQASASPDSKVASLLGTAGTTSHAATVLERLGVPTVDHDHDHTHISTSGPGPAGAPAELAAYGNGRIPVDALAPIGQGSHRLWEPAADAFRSMAAAAARDGVTIDVSDSYRTYDQQVDLAARKGLYSQGGLAAEPGTSNHGWGRALDLDTSGGTVDWLRANAARFGFHEDVPREPWHWTYRPPAG